jgi:hypothetical protein
LTAAFAVFFYSFVIASAGLSGTMNGMIYISQGRTLSFALMTSVSGAP